MTQPQAVTSAQPPGPAETLSRREVREIARKAGRGAVWQFLGGGWHTLVRLAASTVLARVLAPQDFGLFGMALLAKGILNRVGALGMGTGLIAKKAVTDEDLNTCFWTMVGVRTGLFLLAWFGAPLAAVFFQEPRVTPVLRAVALLFLFTLISTVPRALLRKELRFKQLVLSRAVSILAESSLAIFLAVVFDLGYWSLVIALIASSAIEHMIVFFVRPWFPKIMFSKTSFRYLFRFGFSGLLFGIFNYMNQNVDYIIVGRMLGAKVLGLYEFAYRIPHMAITRVARPIGTVAFPAFSRVQDHNELIRQGYLRVVRTTALITWPVLALLAVMAEDVVLVLWGSQWLPIVTPLRILCACAALRVLFQPMGAVFNAKQRPDLPAKFSFVRLCIATLLVIVLGGSFGLNGVALAMLLSVIPSFAFCHIGMRLISSSVYNIIVSIFPVFCSALLASMLVYVAGLLLSFNVLLKILTQSLLYIAIYAVAVMFNPSLKREIYDLSKTIRV